MDTPRLLFLLQESIFLSVVKFVSQLDNCDANQRATSNPALTDSRTSVVPQGEIWVDWVLSR